MFTIIVQFQWHFGMYFIPEVICQIAMNNVIC